MIDLPIEFYRWAWRSLVAAFLVVETLAILDPKRGDTLTEAVRPFIHSSTVGWWIALGIWLWFFPHFLAPSFEQDLHQWVWQERHR